MITNDAVLPLFVECTHNFFLYFSTFFSDKVCLYIMVTNMSICNFFEVNKNVSFSLDFRNHSTLNITFFFVLMLVF